MAKLILVRHSLPEIKPALPANRWILSDVGRRRCRPLAETLTAYRPDVFITSTEPKAVETGRIVSDLLDRPCLAAPGLHEHERPGGVFGSRERFEKAVAGFFAQPGRLVMGRETADQAHHRFGRAVASVIAQYRDQNVSLVTHGTVMTLFVARAAGLEPFSFWKRLGLPAFVVLSLPEFDLLAVVEDVERRVTAQGLQ